jgi:hypothetical protein
LLPEFLIKVEYSIKRKHMCEQRRLNLSIIFLNDAAGERDVGTVEHITYTQKEIFSKLYVFPIYEPTPSKGLHKNVYINTVAVFKRIFYQPFRPGWVLIDL